MVKFFFLLFLFRFFLMKDIRTKKHGFKHSLEHDTHRNTPTIKHTHIKYDQYQHDKTLNIIKHDNKIYIFI